ncbi:MAG: MFS transporter [Eubacterium sp.]
MKFDFKHTVYASYVGYITQAIVNNLAPMLFIIFRDSLSIPLSKITLLVTVNFFIQLAVDYFSTKFVDKIGYRVCIVTAHIFSALGLVFMALLPSVLPDAFAGLLISVVFYAIGGGLIEVLISPIVEACPTDNKASAMSLLHSFYCWGTVLVIILSTVFIHFAGRDRWQILALLWAVVPAVNAFAFTKVPINSLTEDGESMSIKNLLRSKMFWLFVILMVSAGASELAMSQWASALAESGLGVSKAIGDLAGPCMFALLMGLARAVNAKISEKINIVTIMMFSGILCIVSYLMVSISSVPIVALIGCGICGLSVGVMWPGSFSMASEYFPKGGTTLFALLALAGDFGCMSGPTIVGEIAGASADSLKTGLLYAVVFPFILVLSCIVLTVKRRKH